MLEEEKEAEDHELVEAVLRAFPPEKRGEREEWNERVGWHRRENIRKGARHPDRRAASRGPGEMQPPMDQLNFSNRLPTGMVLAEMLMLVLLVYLLAKLLRKKRKGRTH